MVYKRYIKRNGKIFGLYYYKCYRDSKTGKPKNKIINYIEPKKNKFSKLIYVLIAFSLILILGFILLNLNSEKTFKINSLSIKDNSPQISLANSKILGSFIKLIGFDVENEQQEIPEEIPLDIPENFENAPEITEESIENSEEIIENSPESIENESEQNNISETPPKINETNSNVTIETNNSAESIGDHSAESNISENISIINEFPGDHPAGRNISEIIILQENNFTINESTIQYHAKLGEPVKWKKTLKLDAGANSGKICTNSSIGDCQIKENKTLNNLEVTLPKTAGEVSVRKTNSDGIFEELEVNVKNEKIISETEPVIFPQGMTPVSLITGQFTKDENKKNIFNTLRKGTSTLKKGTSKIFKFFRNFVALVGRVIDIGENENEVLVNIQEELEDNDEIEIEYYTEAPYSEEIVFSESHKKINVVGSEEVHYENILAFSNLSKEVFEEKIRLYRTSDGIKEQTGFTAYDNNKNELIDYIEWIVPSLSNQTYELILISKAEHLDENKTFIEDIYGQVKTRDQNFSEIPDGDYVRVTFEKNLTNANDITIYARSENVSEIEVYEFNQTEKIA